MGGRGPARARPRWLVVRRPEDAPVRWGTWFLAGMSGIAAPMNFASRSHWENLIFGPSALVLMVLCILVAQRRRRRHAAGWGHCGSWRDQRDQGAAAGPERERAGQPAAR